MNIVYRRNETFTARMFIPDMGSYTTRAHTWDDLLWHVNSARDHDGLPHLTMTQLKRHRPTITADDKA